jgi:hypothetical protein
VAVNRTGDNQPPLKHEWISPLNPRPYWQRVTVVAVVAVFCSLNLAASPEPGNQAFGINHV